MRRVLVAFVLLASPGLGCARARVAPREVEPAETALPSPFDHIGFRVAALRP
jgi:hypothetical protein